MRIAEALAIGGSQRGWCVPSHNDVNLDGLQGDGARVAHDAGQVFINLSCRLVSDRSAIASVNSM